jgi:hypothetical protein
VGKSNSLGLLSEEDEKVLYGGGMVYVPNYGASNGGLGDGEENTIRKVMQDYFNSKEFKE